jgi:hypothetical protein
MPHTDRPVGKAVELFEPQAALIQVSDDRAAALGTQVECQEGRPLGPFASRRYLIHARRASVSRS